jgi:hypothetical protein
MPKTEIDYSNTIIYKITCIDSNITDVYVGHTTNFVQRKHSHKQNCNNKKSSNYKCKLYEVIRNNGGWNNWKMEIINFFNCKDHYEARQKEQEYFELLKCTLNSIEPIPKQKITPKDAAEITEKQIFHCDKCNINCANAKLFEIHNNTRKHLKCTEIFTADKPLININKFECKACEFTCSKKTNFDLHNQTQKHIHNHLATFNNPEKMIKCKNCKKIYKNRTGLWRHAKVCTTEKVTTQEEQITEKDEITDKELIMMLIKPKNDSKIADNSNLSNISPNFKCNCGKAYKYDSGYYRHKKKCNIKKQDFENKSFELTNETIINLLKQNSDLQLLLLEQNNTIIELTKNLL